MTLAYLFLGFFNFTILSYIRPFFSKRLIYTTRYLITSVYVTVFAIIVKWNQPRCPPADERVAKLQPGCTEAFYTATNIKKICKEKKSIEPRLKEIRSSTFSLACTSELLIYACVCVYGDVSVSGDKIRKVAHKKGKRQGHKEQ